MKHIFAIIIALGTAGSTTLAQSIGQTKIRFTKVVRLHGTFSVSGEDVSEFDRMLNGIAADTEGYCKFGKILVKNQGDVSFTKPTGTIKETSGIQWHDDVSGGPEGVLTQIGEATRSRQNAKNVLIDTFSVFQSPAYVEWDNVKNFVGCSIGPGAGKTKPYVGVEDKMTRIFLRQIGLEVYKD